MQGNIGPSFLAAWIILKEGAPWARTVLEGPSCFGSNWLVIILLQLPKNVTSHWLVTLVSLKAE
jgi:hypothetical protein